MSGDPPKKERKGSLQFNPFKKKKQNDFAISEPRDFRQGVHIEEVEGMLAVSTQ